MVFHGLLYVTNVTNVKNVINDKQLYPKVLSCVMNVTNVILLCRTESGLRTLGTL